MTWSNKFNSGKIFVFHIKYLNSTTLNSVTIKNAISNSEILNQCNIK